MAIKSTNYKDKIKTEYETKFVSQGMIIYYVEVNK